MRVLLVEDDTKLADFVVRGLVAEGHIVNHLTDGREATIAGLKQAYDVIILDRMLPGNDGISMLRLLRAEHCHAPVLLLTAMAGINDRVEGLKAGADDYLVKPFALAELIARVEVLGRRPRDATQTTLQFHDLEMNLVKRLVQRGGKPIDLVNREYDLLEFLMRNAEKIVTRAMLLEQVWELDFDPKTSVVETHISRLRAKVDQPFSPPLIQTVRGLGYRLHAPD